MNVEELVKQNTMSGEILVNERNEIVYVSDSLLGFLGYSKKEFENKYHNRFIDFIHNDQPGFVIFTINDQIKKYNSFILPLHFENKDGHDVTMMASGKTVEGLFYINVMAVQMNEEFIKALHVENDEDALTKLKNRQYIERVFTTKSKGSKYAMLMIDIDNFKHINDTFGHEEGDKVIIKSANVIQDVFKDYYVSRYGGDEFLIYINDVESKEVIDGLCETLQARYDSDLAPYMNIDSISLSIGVCLETEEDTYASVLKKTDVALYNAKSTGKDKTVFYTNHLDFAVIEDERNPKKDAVYYNMMGRVSYELLMILSKGGKEAFKEAIAFVGKAFGIDKIMVLEKSMDGEFFCMNEVWTAIPENNKIMGIREWRPNQLASPDYKNGYVYVADLKDMHNERARERLAAQGIKSFMNVEIRQGGEIAGYIWYDFYKTNQLNSIEEEALLVVTQILGENIRYRKCHQILDGRNFGTVELADATDLCFAVINRDNFEVVCANQTAREFLDNVSQKVIEQAADSHNKSIIYNNRKYRVLKSMWDMEVDAYIIFQRKVDVEIN